MANTQNTVCFFLFDTKFICHHLFLVVADKRETKYENKSTALDTQREINRHEKREKTQILILSLSCLFEVLSSHLRGRFGTPSKHSPQNGCSTFQPVFTSSWLVSNSSFSCFLSRTPLNGSPFEFLLAFRFVADIFLFLIRASAAIPT